MLRHKTNVCLRDLTSESARERSLLLLFLAYFIYILKSPVRSLNPNYLPSAYLFAYNCEPSRRLQTSDLHLLPLSLIKGHTPIFSYLTFVTPINVSSVPGPEWSQLPLSQRWQRELDGSPRCIMPYLYTRLCYDSELLTRSNCDRNPRQPCILSSPPARGSD